MGRNRSTSKIQKMLERDRDREMIEQRMVGDINKKYLENLGLKDGKAT
jgi:hypothetical protein